MKTTKLLFLGILGLCSFLGNAQWVLTGNANATATSFIGTTVANPAVGQDINFKRAGVAAGLLNTTKTSFGVNSLSMPNSVSIGVSAGQFSSGTGSNTYIGQNAGRGISATTLNNGNNNTFLGYNSGLSSFNGSRNTYIGSTAGNASSGSANIFVGFASGENNGSGSNNVYLGNYAGAENSGNNNLFLGSQAGGESLGSNNILLGTNSGYYLNDSNKLMIDYVDNTAINNTNNPLIWGDFATDQLKFHGKVGIGGNTATAFGNFPSNSGGVSVSNYNLFVKGGILTDEVRVSTTWADYVFAKEYKLPTLHEVEKHIQENGHLINVPSAQRVKEDGIELGEMAKIQQEKIEELTLYIIEQNKINEAQNKLILQMSDRLNAIEKR